MLDMLADRAVIALSGPEAHSFLQGLVTNDVAEVAPDRPAYTALLTPQGKILFDFLLYDGGGALLIDCLKTAREALIGRLSMYKLRARIEITARDDLNVVTAGPPDPRLAALGLRSVVAATGKPAEAAYHARRLDLGVPEGADFGTERLFALDAGLDELHAISFAKGCYVGQELTARMKHRGKDRKRLLPVTAAVSLPPCGTPVTCGDVELGSIVSTYGQRGFALIRLDRLDGAPVTAAGIAVAIGKPSWLFA
jgi:tRNA-modifying protein YgfZ